MTAGRGISHSERFDGMRDSGGAVHGLQAWVALPEAHEEVAPKFEHYGRAEIPSIELAAGQGRLIAGTAFGKTSTVRTHSPLFYAHLDLPSGARVEVPGGYRGAGGLRGQWRGGVGRSDLRAKDDAGLSCQRTAGPHGAGCIDRDAAWRRASRPASHLVELRLVTHANASSRPRPTGRRAASRCPRPMRRSGYRCPKGSRRPGRIELALETTTQRLPKLFQRKAGPDLYCSALLLSNGCVSETRLASSRGRLKPGAPLRLDKIN